MKEGQNKKKNALSSEEVYENFKERSKKIISMIVKTSKTILNKNVENNLASGYHSYKSKLLGNKKIYK